MGGSWVQDTAYSIVMFILQQVTGQWSNQAWVWFSQFFSPPLAVIDDPAVQLLTHVTVAAAMGFLPVVVAWTALRETIARMDGASTMAPETLVRRAIVTGVAVTGTSLAAWFIGTLADLAREVVGAVGLDINLLKDFFLISMGAPTTVMMMILVFIVGAIILTIQRIVIMAEFTVLVCVGPLLAVGLMREGSSSTWSIWLREVVSLVITPIIQMLVLLLFLRKYGGAGPLDMVDRVASLGFLWVLYNIPRWARQMVYQVGAGGMVVNAAMSAGRFAMMRKMMSAATKG
jgi:hypothetical protein